MPLYAEDVVILADDPKTLQTMIHKLEKHCKDCGMTVNEEKSKIMVFKKGWKLLRDECWTFNENPIEIS